MAIRNSVKKKIAVGAIIFLCVTIVLTIIIGKNSKLIMIEDQYLIGHIFHRMFDLIIIYILRFSENDI